MKLENMEKNNFGDKALAAETFLVKIPGSKALAKVSCRWRLSTPTTGADADAPQYFQSLDLLMEIVPISCINEPCEDRKNGGLIPYATGTTLETLVRACCTIQASVNQVKAAAKVILVPRNGYLCRSDILELRMRHSQFVGSVIRFPGSNGYFSPITDQAEGNLLVLLSSSPGALIVKPSPASDYETLDLIEGELRVRLSFDWVLPTEPAVRKLALVGGRPQFNEKNKSFGHEGTFEAALGLGISITVVDRPGHWLEGKKYSYLRDDFIPVDVINDANLPSRIAEVLKERKIDGIVTFSDEFVIATAKAAGILGLRTEPIQAIVHAHHKYEMRKLLDSNTQTLRLDNAAQLDDPSVAQRVRDMQFPLVVKPCRDGASRGVKKVGNYSSMCQAVQQLEECGFSKYGILLETYINGPEVDANFVLWDGEVLSSKYQMISHARRMQMMRQLQIISLKL
ncbi:uncharacterized protein GIQ15_03148 [Arthroderma uncinatum]|uniref:uncharacterized protein n=1 Tax=Arthroderma uncinatum TaxID=74035 RepID=UPI00144A76D0|nr:uncharacterized protein GIQ15_03148 [Arthroderma uncinatum]KAF3483824.1 hypothetical protein GIQ15_03148 [Arthroderma uncinatum]